MSEFLVNEDPSVKIGGKGNKAVPYFPEVPGNTSDFLTNLAETCVSTKNIALDTKIHIRTEWGGIYVERENKNHPNRFIGIPDEGEIDRIINSSDKIDATFRLRNLIVFATQAAAAFTEAELKHRINQLISSK